jgi:hypothetical protein
MAAEPGRCLPLSLPRRLMADLLYFSRQAPLIPMERCMHLGKLVAARLRLRPRPAWCAIFTKAYACVAARRPELRRAYLSCPWPHLYEHPHNVAAVAVERRLGDEDVIVFANLSRPEALTLPQLDDWLHQCKEGPIEAVHSYQRALWITRLPRPLRRLLWWLGMQWWGKERARAVGTFGVSVTAGQGAGQLALLSPCTTTLHYGLFDAAGALPVRLTFDHRVLDGAAVARGLVELEEVLRDAILAELHSLARMAA